MNKLETKNSLEKPNLTPKGLTPDYLEPFFVGLFEGDGCLYIGRTKHGPGKPSLTYPGIQINLKNETHNVIMLDLLANYFGGGLSYKKKTDKVVWAANSQSSLKKIFNVFKRYPLLTSRKICMLNHAQACLKNRSWLYHKETRDFKYENQSEYLKKLNADFKIPSYFPAWISGFFEAEGHFGSTHALRVYISQNDDWYLLNAIKAYFSSRHKLGLHKDARRDAKHYRLSMTGKPVLKNIIAHFEAYALLGAKRSSFSRLRNKFVQKSYVS